jgi:protein O-mannosyl-transferase
MSGVLRRNVPALAAAAMVAAAALIAYRGSFRVPLVYDDLGTIAQNPTILNLATALHPPPGGLPVSGRPVANLSFALDYALHGGDLRGYHATNLLIHVLAALTLYGVVRRTALRWNSLHPEPSDFAGISDRIQVSGLRSHPSAIAFLIALLWVLHPLQTESVTYLSQRAESLMGLFYLLTLYCFIRYAEVDGLDGVLTGQARTEPPSFVPRCGTSEGEQARRRPWFWLSIGACLLGMGTKEVMATAPLVVLLYDRTFAAGSFRGALRLRGRYYAALALLWIPLGALVLGSGSRGGTAGFGGPMSWNSYAVIQVHAIPHYLRLALWPSPLLFAYPRHPGIPAAVLAADVAVLVAIAWVALRGLAARSPWGFLAAAFLVVLAPSSSVIPVATETMAEHRMYLPLAAVVTALVLAAGALGRRLPREGRWVPWAGAVAAASALGLATGSRNLDYRSEAALWEDVVSKAPGNSEAHNNLGYALLQSGDLAGALAQCDEAVRLDPANAKARANRADALMKAGRAAEAVRGYEEALAFLPGDAETLNNLGLALAGDGRLAEAMARYREAISRKPYLAQIHNNLGLALVRAGRVEEGIGEYARALELSPAYAEAEYNLGTALSGAGRAAEAELHLERSVRMNPGFADAREKLGELLVQVGRVDEAIARFEQALRLQPRYLEARCNLGMALAQRGRVGEAIGQFEEAVGLQPGNPALHNLLGCALAEGGRVGEARREFGEALRLNPGDGDARSNLARLPAGR